MKKIIYDVIDENTCKHCNIGDYVQVIYDDNNKTNIIRGYISNQIDFGVLAIEDEHNKITFIEIYKICKIEKFLL